MELPALYNLCHRAVCINTDQFPSSLAALSPDSSCPAVPLCIFPLLLQLGPLRAVEGVAEIAGSLSAAGLVIILAVCLSIYGSASFQTAPQLGVKTLSGRSVQRDPLQSADG